MKKFSYFKFSPHVLFGLFFPLTALATKATFSGIYAGANLGVSQMQLKKERFAEILLPEAFDITLTPYELKLTDISMVGSLTLGFSKIVKKKYFLGLETRINFEDLNIKSQIHFQEIFAPFLISDNYFLKLNQDFEILSKFGIILDQKYLIFGVLGPDWGKFEVSNYLIYTQQNGETLTGNLYSEDKAYKAGLVIGLGTEYAILENTTIGMEYHYIFHNKLNFSNPLPSILTEDNLIQAGSSITEQNGLKSKINRFMIKLNYYFS